MDIAALICGIVGLVLSCIGIGIIPSIIAIVLGAKYISNYGKDTKSIIGIVLGSVGSLLAIVMILAFASGDKTTATNESKEISTVEVANDQDVTTEKENEKEIPSTSKKESKKVEAEKKEEVVREESPEEKLLKSATTSQKNALKSAKSYLNYSAFSYEGLIHQLEYEKYSTEDATWAADNCGANWYEQAEKQAKSYLDYSAFSHDGLIHQLEYEGFTTDEATKAADKIFGDTSSAEASTNDNGSGSVSKDNALRSAKSYLDYSAFSHKGLISQLEYEGYSEEDATYAADNCGADWNEQAAKAAKSYLEFSSFSRAGLIDQLVYEGYTNAQAEYGADAVGL